MKRIQVFFMVMVVLITCILSGCTSNDIDWNELKLECSYELVAVKANVQTQVSGEFSSIYVLGIGGGSGTADVKTTKVYDFWYKRDDGGIIPDTIDLESYTCPENVKIVIYESDSVKPKFEIWRNEYAREYGDGSGWSSDCRTEIRFTIPTGAFVNTYDFQNNTDSQ